MAWGVFRRESVKFLGVISKIILLFTIYYLGIINVSNPPAGEQAAGQGALRHARSFVAATLLCFVLPFSVRCCLVEWSFG